MVLSAIEIEQRHHRVGASDVATILGMPTFRNRNAYTTWLEKCDMLEPEKRTDASITAGNRLEPVVLDFAEEQYGDLDRNVVVWDKQGAPIASTLDGQVKANGRPVEAKTSGIEGPIHGTWGEAGSDEVPDGYIIQCQTQLLCT
ncbi:MAG: YqaJ viral recombinase family protein, partial [Phycisphaeraceae bacterium JB051]